MQGAVWFLISFNCKFTKELGSDFFKSVKNWQKTKLIWVCGPVFLAHPAYVNFLLSLVNKIASQVLKSVNLLNAW